MEHSAAASIALRVAQGVPDYREFMTVDELKRSSKELASRHRMTVELVEAGESRSGEPIHALVIGGYEDRRVLAFAFSHPNEPVGSLTLEYLSRRLAGDLELLSTLRATWIIVKVVDVYGARLNEGWFRGPFDVRKYVLNFYRPPPHKQVEWSFPIEYKTLRWSRPLPETRALMRLIDEWRPTHMFNLHNTGFTGAYYHISHPLPPEAAEFLSGLPPAMGIPLHRGEPEEPYVERWGPGIFKLVGTPDIYDYLEKYLGVDPAKVMRRGGSSYDYAKRSNPGVFALVSEVPYMYDDRLDNETAIGVPRREVLLLSINRAREELRGEVSFCEKLRRVASRGNPFYESFREYVGLYLSRLEAEKKWVERSQDPSLDRSATVAEAFDSYRKVYWYSLLRWGMAYRAVLAELNRRGLSPTERRVLENLREEALNNIVRLFRTFDTLAKYRVIPLRRLVSVQVASVLYTVMAVEQGGAGAQQ